MEQILNKPMLFKLMILLIIKILKKGSMKNFKITINNKILIIFNLKIGILIIQVILIMILA
jgi:hypothetical protein